MPDGEAHGFEQEAWGVEGAHGAEIPVCVWADYSTIGMVQAFDMSLVLTGGKGMPQDKVADLAAKLYKNSRTKV